MARNVVTGDDKVHEMREIIYVAPSCIELDPNLLARESPVDDDAIARMVASLRKFGQLQPIKARKITGPDGINRLRAIFGNTRTRAGRVIEADDPAFRLHVHVVKVNEEEAFTMAIEENRERNKTTPIDDAVNARRLMDSYGWDKTRVAQLYGGITVQAVDNLLTLLTLPTAIRDRVRDGNLPASVALQHLVGLDDAEAVAIVKDAEQVALEGGDAAQNGVEPATIPFDDSIPPASEALPDDGDDGADVGTNIDIHLQSESNEPSSEMNGDLAGEPTIKTQAVKAGKQPKPPKVPKAPKQPKLGKNGQVKLTGADVAAAKRRTGKVAKRTWSEVRTLIAGRDDIVCRAIIEFQEGRVDEAELSRVLDEAADAMEAYDVEVAAKAARKTTKAKSVGMVAAQQAVATQQAVASQSAASAL